MLDEEEFADRWEAGVLGRAITHEEHLRIARVLLRRHTRQEATRRLVDGTRTNCASMDAADRFDEPLTRRWCDRIADAVQSGDSDTFEEFILLHPELARSDLLGVPAWRQRAAGDRTAQALGEIADWGPEEEWSDWRKPGLDPTAGICADYPDWPHWQRAVRGKTADERLRADGL